MNIARVLAASTVLAASAAAQTPPPPGGGMPAEVVIKAEGAGSKLNDQKPPLKIEVDPFESIRASLKPDENLPFSLVILPLAAPLQQGEKVALRRSWLVQHLAEVSERHRHDAA